MRTFFMLIAGAVLAGGILDVVHGDKADADIRLIIALLFLILGRLS